MITCLYCRKDIKICVNNECLIAEKIMKIMELDSVSYAYKIINSLKLNLPIPAATPKQIYQSYKILFEL